MDINYELYKVFYYVASSLSFSEASKQLFISQSAVSQSIKTLEKKIRAAPFYPQHQKGTAYPCGKGAVKAYISGELHQQRHQRDSSRIAEARLVLHHGEPHQPPARGHVQLIRQHPSEQLHVAPGRCVVQLHQELQLQDHPRPHGR